MAAMGGWTGPALAGPRLVHDRDLAAASVSEWRVGAADGARRRGPAVFGDLAELRDRRQFFRGASAQRRAGLARDRVDAGHHQRRDRSLGGIDGRARRGGVWRGRAGLATCRSTAAALVALLTGLAGGALNGLLIARFDIPPLIVTLGTFSLFRGIAEGMTHAAVNYTGFPASFLALGQGYLGGIIPAQLAIFLVVLAGYVDPVAPVGHRARDLRDRLRCRRCALRRRAREATPRAGLRAVGPRGQPCGDRLRRASRPGAIGRRHRLRARRHRRGGARRHLGLRRPWHAVGHADRSPLTLRAAQRRAARGASIRAHRRLDGRPAGDDDCHRPLARSRRRRAAAIFGGPRREEQSSGHALRRDHRRRNRRGRHERLARPIAAIGRPERHGSCRPPARRRRRQAASVWSSR